MSSFQMRQQPIVEPASLLDARIDHVAGDGVAGVVAGVALAPQGVQKHPGGVVHAEREWQGLDQRHMVTGLAGEGAEPCGQHGSQRTLHHGLVRSIEPGFVTDAGLSGVIQVAGDGRQQALNLRGRRVVRLELADAQPVVQSHLRCP